MRSNLIDLLVDKHHETELAVLVSETGRGDDGVWLPKSEIEIAPASTHGLYDLTLPEWLAQDKGLI